MKNLYFGLILAFSFLFPRLSLAHNFEVVTDSATGKKVVILEDGTVVDRHPALKEFDQGRAPLTRPVAAPGELASWQTAFEQGRKQMTASRVCFVGAVLVPLFIYNITDDPAAQPDQIVVGAGLGVMLGLIGMGLDVAAQKNYTRSIHLHLDASGVGVGLPLR